jgi:hypothetical protein
LLDSKEQEHPHNRVVEVILRQEVLHLHRGVIRRPPLEVILHLQVDRLVEVEVQVVDLREVKARDLIVVIEDNS